jgi:hypothetical protein
MRAGGLSVFAGIEIPKNALIDHCVFNQRTARVAQQVARAGIAVECRQRRKKFAWKQYRVAAPAAVCRRLNV